jgi:hypothetical protein
MSEFLRWMDEEKAMRDVYSLPTGNCPWCLTGEGDTCQDQMAAGCTPTCPRPFPWEEEVDFNDLPLL